VTTSTAQKVLVRAENVFSTHHEDTIAKTIIQAPEGSFLSNECLALLIHLGQEYRNAPWSSIDTISTSEVMFGWRADGKGAEAKECIRLSEKVAQGIEACDQTGWVIPNDDFDAWVDGTPAGRNLKHIAEMA
jgi:hypothetical protein